MGHACTRQDFPRCPPRREHPVTAVVGVVAILVAILLISWVRIAVRGTEDFEVFAEPGPAASHTVPAENEAASSRWATGFSH